MGGTPRCCRTSKPLKPGISISRNSTSSFAFSICSSASTPSRASTTSMSGCSKSMFLSWSRGISSSSTTIVRIMAPGDRQFEDNFHPVTVIPEKIKRGASMKRQSQAVACIRQGVPGPKELLLLKGRRIVREFDLIRHGQNPNRFTAAAVRTRGRHREPVQRDLDQAAFSSFRDYHGGSRILDQRL